MLKGWRDEVRALKRELAALALAARDPRTPWLARLLILGVVAYALSPIDLIPDFIPVLGLLDDLLIVPAGLWLALRLVPPDVMAEARRTAGDSRLAASRPAALAIVALWLVSAAALAVWAWSRLS